MWKIAFYWFLKTLYVEAGSVAATDPNSVLKHFPLNFNILVFDNDDFFWLPKSSRTQKAIHEFMTEQNAFLEL